MKQIDRKYLCYWCLGCTGQEEGYIPKQRCKRIYIKQTRLARKMEGGKMEEKLIIELWRNGLTVQQVSREYMNSYNKKIKSGQKRITKIQAQMYVEPIIFKYQTNMLKA